MRPPPTPAADNSLAPPRVKIGLDLPGCPRRLTSVHYSGPGEVLTLCRYEDEQKTGKVVSCGPTDEPLACTKCARMIEEAKAKPGFGSPEHRAALERGIALGKLGVAGVTGRGTIVDRREVPDAGPIQANSMMGVPKPLRLMAKLAPGECGQVDRENGVYEMGSDPAGETDCGKRGINHIMRSEHGLTPRCLSPGCAATSASF